MHRDRDVGVAGKLHGCDRAVEGNREVSGADNFARGACRHGDAEAGQERRGERTDSLREIRFDRGSPLHPAIDTNDRAPTLARGLRREQEIPGAPLQLRHKFIHVAPDCGPSSELEASARNLWG